MTSLRHENVQIDALEDECRQFPLITQGHVDALTEKVDYQIIFGELCAVTIAVVSLKNGHIVIGVSTTSSPGRYDEKVGKRHALNDARSKILYLLGYSMRNEACGFSDTTALSSQPIKGVTKPSPKNNTLENGPIKGTTDVMDYEHELGRNFRVVPSNVEHEEGHL